MNWDQIENNWAAMTRRVRPDLPARAPCDADTGRVNNDAVEGTADLNDRVSPPPVRHGA